MVDLALISEDLFFYDPKIKELVAIYEQRIAFMKKTYLFQNQYCLQQLTTFDSKNGSAKGEMSLIEGVINPLRKM